jgi:hypothetical protein
MADEHDDELEEELEEDIDEIEVDDDLDPDIDGDLGDDDDLLDSSDDDIDDAAEEDSVPTASATVAAEDDDDDDLNPDDVETDLDTILKGRLSASDDDDEDEEEEEGQPDSTSEGGKVPAKADNEFTCTTCFMIHHPRQFGRAGAFTCPEGYDPCDGIAVVEASLKKSRKG